MLKPARNNTATISRDEVRPVFLDIAVPNRMCSGFGLACYSPSSQSWLLPTECAVDLVAYTTVRLFSLGRSQPNVQWIWSRTLQSVFSVLAAPNRMCSGFGRVHYSPSFQSWPLPTECAVDLFAYTTVRLFSLGRSEQNAQWIWSSPLTEMKIIGYAWVAFGPRL
jgi:hypothetical protein